MGVINRLAATLFGKANEIDTRAALGVFIDERASFLSQKCIVEFSRVRAGVYWQKLFSEAEFQSELTRSTWRAYPACMAMVAEMVEGAMREHAGLRQRQLPEALERLCAEIVSKYPVPAGEESDFWARGVAMVRKQLDETQGSAPRPVREMPKPMARAVFDVMPMHKNVITNDYDYIFNNLRMNLLRAHDDFIRQARYPGLVDDLLGRG